ncbi:MAG: insulinase family protein [Verrucomicrobia bacterium]|nr:insulinase family protein [Verrucomicrobiota bacterium]
MVPSRFFARLAAACFLCFLLWSAPANVQAADDNAPTTEKAAAGSHRIAFTEYDLPNGLHVILAPDATAPVVSSYLLYHVGSKDERPDRTGFAHFFEHLMFEGSEFIARGQIDKLISSAGGNLNASTSYDQTDYHINLPANQLALALWIESERMLHAKIDETGVETQRQVVKEERRMRYDNQPYGGLFEETSRLVFKDTPYAWVPIGSAQYIDRATIEEFRDFYKTWYRPNNATLALCGDFEIESTKKLIAEYFGPIPRADLPARARVEPPEQRQEQTHLVRRPNTPLPATLHAWRVPPETDADAYALDLLSNLLATGRSSRLYRRLVDTEQVAVSVQAFPYLQESIGMLGVFAIGQRGVDLKKLDALLDEEIARVQKDGVTEEEFQKTRNGKESELAGAHGSAATRARALAHYHVFYHDTGLVNTELERYLAVTRDDLQRVAKKYLTTDTKNLISYPPMGSPTEKSKP